MSAASPSFFLLLPNFILSPPPTTTKPHHRHHHHVPNFSSKCTHLLLSSTNPRRRITSSSTIMVHCSSTPDSNADSPSDPDADPLLKPSSFEITTEKPVDGEDLSGKIWEWLLLVSPFFFWGTAMVAMKGVIPKTGPFFVSSFRLIPAGALLVGFAAAKGRKQPSGALAWLSIALFAAVDAACFQVGRR